MTPYIVLALSVVLAQDSELDRRRNVGKAYYEQGDYALAVEELAAVLDSTDARPRDYFNAAMAYLQNADHEPALAAFTTAGQMDPEMIAVDFGLGVLYKRQLRYPLAHESFSKVAARDPNDPSTQFNIGAVSASMRQIEEAEKAFARVIAMGHARAQNFYVSALFRQATILAQRGEQETAQGLFEEFQSLRNTTPNVSLTATALEAGRYGRVEIPIGTADPIAAPAVDIELETLSELRFADSPCELEPSLALSDYDSDGDLDVFVASPCGRDVLFENEGGGELTDSGLAPSGGSTGAVFADFDNSGVASLFAWDDSASYLYGSRDRRFADVTAAAGLSGGATVALTFDADNDGRLDLFVSRPDDGLILYRNLDDGKFTPVWQDSTVHARGAASVDLDDNGFMDVVIVPASGEGLVLSNEGGSFDQASIDLGLSATSPAPIRVLDLDHDGRLDVVAHDANGASTLVNRSGRLELFPSLRGWASLTPVDLDGDGYTSFLALDTGGRHALVSYQGAERFGTHPIDLAGDASKIETLDATHFVSAGRDGMLRVFERTRPASPAWLTIDLDGTKTNRQAIGAVVEVKAGSFYQKHLYPGYPMTRFVGDRDELDVVRVTWANGVIQNEVDVATRQVLSIEESEQQTSSCPFLYIWDGETFRFLTDVVGRAPLGEILPGGGMVEPNPEDYIRIPPGAMVERDGRFDFRLTEELRELAAIDAVELVVVDHPGNVDVYVNERFSAPPFEPFRLYPASKTWTPSSATNDSGLDVLAELSDADGRYVTNFERHRIAGFAEDHALVLTIPESARDEPLWLFLTGWVYWPSSSSMLALDAHESMAPLPPALQVKDPSGHWVTVMDDLGLPSGIGRTLVADLTDKFLSDDGQVRIVSNFAVYWDRALFASADNDSAIHSRTLAASAAELHYRGFSAVSLDEREQPERYEYNRLRTEAPWNAVTGRYTRYGDVVPIVSGADGASVVMAPGDEMTLSFEGGLPAPKEGWSRTLFLHVTGWAKDQDPNTLSSRTVGPLPATVPPSMMRYQTRKVPSLIAPLAPPKPR